MVVQVEFKLPSGLMVRSIAFIFESVFSNVVLY